MGGLFLVDLIFKISHGKQNWFFNEKEKHNSFKGSSSNTGDNMENNIFAHIFSFFEDFSIGAAATAF
ncbi:hypothetical protein RhiirA1_477709 [Rhizophagus irregularis]|uniref:Uncharacterized protein n=1 Tax=Rhizophagus irregularis TaxID=588596 RepID=A0A2N0QT40_9GLOM|nr:hypothetical protein RhiirA1_477709 [Rhizophagus irregularis]GET58561.1 hypothetical protein RIR_jg14357.t1 [Rhizophagus irregularis DAOM 181602=DAOM 197198]